MSISRGDQRPPFRQVADQLRAEILNGTYEASSRLPSQALLCERFGVSRMTVQQALRELRHEGLIVSRQGSGVYVRDRRTLPVDLRPLIESAFDGGAATVDFVGFTAESLSVALHEPLEKIRQGFLTAETLKIRLLLADTRGRLAVPARVDGSSSREVLKRMQKTTERYAGGLRETVDELVSMGLLRRGSVEVRYVASSPMMKMILINRRDLLFGFYPVTEHTVTIGGRPTEIYDILGRDVAMFRKSLGTPDLEAPDYINAAQAWVDSAWTTIAKATDE